MLWDVHGDWVPGFQLDGERAGALLFVVPELVGVSGSVEKREKVRQPEQAGSFPHPSSASRMAPGLAS